MSAPPRVVLASASPRRRELLGALIPEFAVDAADVPEILGDDPIDDALRLARDKAECVRARYGAGWLVIGADTIVFDDARSYGKPADAHDARAMLVELRGRTHSVVTGVAIALDGDVREVEVLARVALTKMDDATVEAYVASGRPLDKAGAYAIQDEDIPTVRRLWGCRCAVMGLPLWHVSRLLAPLGIPLKRPDATYARCAGCPGRA